MEISRSWAMPSHNTFSIDPINKLITKYILLYKPTLIVISFGWNSGGIGKKYGFEIAEILMVAHGGWHNDTICTVEMKLH